MLYFSAFLRTCKIWKKLKLEYIKNKKNKNIDKKIKLVNDYYKWQQTFNNHPKVLRYIILKNMYGYNKQKSKIFNTIYLDRYNYSLNEYLGIENEKKDLKKEEKPKKIFSTPIPGKDPILLNPTEDDLVEARFLDKMFLITDQLNDTVDKAEKWNFLLDDHLSEKLNKLKTSTLWKKSRKIIANYLDKHYMLTLEVMYNREYLRNKQIYLHYRKSREYPTLFLPLKSTLFLSNVERTKLFNKLISENINNITDETILRYRRRNIYVSLLSPKLGNQKFYYPLCESTEEYMNYNMYWDINSLYYKFIGFLIRSGKKEKAEYILNNSLSFIKDLISCNPLLLFMRSIYNSQFLFEFSKQKRRNKTLLIPRIVPLSKRVRIAMRLLAKNVRSNVILRKMKKMKKYKMNTSYILSNIFFSYFFKIGEIREELKMNIKNAFKQKYLLKKNTKTNTAFKGSRLLKFLGFRKINGYYISK